MSVNSELTALADAIREKSGVSGKLSIDAMTAAVNNISASGTGGIIDVVKVTEYIPHQESFLVPDTIEISGIQTPHSNLNGVYKARAFVPMDGTPPDLPERVYRGRERFYYFRDNDDQVGWPGQLLYEVNEDESGYWLIRNYSTKPLYYYYCDASIPFDENNPPGGTHEWESSSGEMVELTLNLTYTRIPERDEVIKGVKAIGQGANGNWIWSEEETTFKSSDITPVAGQIFAASETDLFGAPIGAEYNRDYGIDFNTLAFTGFEDEDGDGNALFYLAAGSSKYGLARPDDEHWYPVPGVHGTALDFQGSYFGFRAGECDDFIFRERDFTIEAYIYPKTTLRQCFFAYWHDQVFSVCFSYSGDCRIGVFGTARGWTNVIMSDPLELDKWHHLAIVRKGNVLYCFVDFKPTGYTADMTDVSVGQQLWLGNWVYFGKWGDDPGDFSARWQGYMDDVRISNIARYQP